MKRTCQYVILALWLVLGPLGGDGLRRHRHRRDEESELNAEQKENKHKPKFERCDDYHFSVLEESNAGKKLFHYYSFPFFWEEIIQYVEEFTSELSRKLSLVFIPLFYMYAII